MKHLVSIAVMVSMVIAMVGCAQGADNTPSSNSPSGSTDLATSPGGSGKHAQTTEQTTEQTTPFYRIPVEGGGGVLECANSNTKGAVYDYAQGIGQKASPVQQTRRKFSKRIEDGDEVEISDQRGPPEGYYDGAALRTVRVLRDGRVVALMLFYREGQDGEGGWLLDSYEACGEF
jgi:hypothetical protein